MIPNPGPSSPHSPVARVIVRIYMYMPGCRMAWSILGVYLEERDAERYMPNVHCGTVATLEHASNQNVRRWRMVNIDHWNSVRLPSWGGLAIFPAITDLTGWRQCWLLFSPHIHVHSVQIEITDDLGCWRTHFQVICLPGARYNICICIPWQRINIADWLP